jgi:hypothetical protein
MNAQQLRKNLGQRLKLRPVARRQLANGTPLGPVDDEWFVQSIKEQQVELYNMRTGHILDLGFDNIREYRSPNFLLLRCQVILRGASRRFIPACYEPHGLTYSQRSPSGYEIRGIPRPDQ